MNEELDEVLEDEEKRERFRIENDSQATWAMKKLREVLNKRHEQISIGEYEILMIKTWIEEVSGKYDYNIQYFEGLLKDYGRRQREEGVKTVTTPYGKIASRMAEFKINCANPDEFIEWAETALPQVVRVKKEMATSVIKELVKDGTLIADFESLKMITSDGEVMPAIVLVPPSLAVTITTEK